MSSSTKSNIYFDFEQQRWKGISPEKLELWQECFPDVDVVYHLSKRMKVWLLTNPEKAHKKKWEKFITNWLGRQQDKVMK